MRRNSPRSLRPSISKAMCWDRSPSATASSTRAISAVGAARSSISPFTACTPRRPRAVVGLLVEPLGHAPSRPTTRLIRSRSRLCRSCSATSSLNCSTTSLAGPSRRARRTSKRPRRTCASPCASSTRRARPRDVRADASSGTTAGVLGVGGNRRTATCRVAVMTASSCSVAEADGRSRAGRFGAPDRCGRLHACPFSSSGGCGFRPTCGRSDAFGG